MRARNFVRGILRKRAFFVSIACRHFFFSFVPFYHESLERCLEAIPDRFFFRSFPFIMSTWNVAWKRSQTEESAEGRKWRES